MDNTFYSQGKLKDYAEAFRRLTQVYEGNKSDALALQLRETAAMLERVTGEGKARFLLTEEEKERLQSYFKSCGVSVGGMLVVEPLPGHIELILKLSKERRGCVTVKNLAEDLSGILHRQFRAARGSRQIVTREPAEFVFEESTKYRLLFGHAGCNKGFSRVSGDNYSFLSIEGGKTVVSLADGMGCGKEANSFSTRFIETLEQLLETGFSEQAAVELLNNVFAANDTVGTPVTLDMCSINEYDGTADFRKMGAAASFIKGREKVRTLNSSSLPAGVISGTYIDHQSEKLSDGDYIIMMSDGVLDALPFYDKEKRMGEIIGEIDEKMPQAIAERILGEVFFYNEKIADDMTVLVTGVWKLKTGDYNV